MIALDNVTKRYDGHAVVSDMTLQIAAGAFAVLIGPSGCGKSTVLRMMNGLIAPDSGTILVRDQAVGPEGGDALRRSIGYVIQSVGLFPHWSVADNILAVPHLLHWAREKCAARLDELVALVGIDRALLPRRPAALSGGQQQRIGIARALAADPDIVLMDEPFAALDPLSRATLQSELRRIHRDSRKTFVFVTHDMDEALRLATQLFVLRAGRIVQAGSPADVLAAPADPFVESFLGGADLPLRRLDHIAVRARVDPAPAIDCPVIAADATLRAALTLMVGTQSTQLRVQDGGVDLGSVTLDAMIRPTT